MTQQPKWDIGGLILAPIVLGVFVGLAYGAVQVVSTMSGASCSKTAAELYSRGVVRNELKTPASASFGPRRIQEHKDCTFTIDGVVDAHNSYGATTRSRYSVVVRYVDGSWVRL